MSEQIKVYGDRPPMEDMIKRLGADAAKTIIPAVSVSTRGYGTRVWIKDEVHPYLEWVRQQDGQMAQIPTPAVVAYHRTRGGRIMASWVVQPKYSFLNEETMQPLCERPKSFPPAPCV